jgi:acyl-CoA reductase-like NAD-dependent aldehyde dehydrogenase
MIPAPKRGEVVRQIGAVLRDHRKSLAEIISLEVGKIRAEAEGEVQEMIDMADFAVGQSRILYGGREAGSDTWKSYMRRHTSTINWSQEMPLAQGIEFGVK